MQKIGEGYYYFVYDIGNNKVLKKQKSNFRIFVFVLFANRFNLVNTIIEFRKAIKAIPLIESVYKRVSSSGINLSLLGNPKFFEGISYEQEKVNIIRDIMGNLSNDEFGNLISLYIGLVKELWKYGLHEEIFNFQLNNGINKNGDFVLIDFNEIIFDKETILRDIQNKVWLQRAAYYFLDDIRKKIYSESMEKEINVDNFNRIFNSSV
jgi:hypothetical protein